MGRSTRGEFNLLWVVVTVVSIVMAVVILYIVYNGATKSLSIANSLTGQATTAGGQLIINLKAAGVGTITISNVTLYSGSSTVTSGCTLSSVMLNGQPLSTTSPPWSLKPGDTLSLIYSGSSCSSVTTVDVTTNAGTQPITVS
ncbi:hypothetical protein [Vulcanisaeta distributa]|uniref:Archaeal Type IV pilin N-terminal domain-containing protein n=1 Tax=Vulcanisaeta distributa (strain DSM 14429 / JCM 11212 / NBRC 100878 / IC-017) TaxID=572478 RepID=E1QQE0_VULDI|nr:hypothetical protein [Vulcanisaeta distributa]ADN51627.1 hypothetical protein Vdis_2259 [Vulcanisaeta distributa DSM 14429]